LIVGMLSRAWSGVPSLGVGPVGVGVGVAVGVGVVVVVVVLGVTVVVELDAMAAEDGLVTGDPAVEHAPSSPSTPNAATTAGARYPCMDDGNPAPCPPTELR